MVLTAAMSDVLYIWVGEMPCLKVWTYRQRSCNQRVDCLTDVWPDNQTYH